MKYLFLLFLLTTSPHLVDAKGSSFSSSARTSPSVPVRVSPTTTPSIKIGGPTTGKSTSFSGVGSKSSDTKPAAVIKASTPTIKIDTSKPVKATSFNQAQTSKDYKDIYNQYKQSFEKPKFSAADLHRMQSTPKPQRRNEFYNGYQPAYYSSAPVMISHSYGSHDGLAMWAMMDGIGDALMMYNHRNEPDYQAWRSEADALAAKDAAVKAKLDALDAKMTAMEKDGVPKDPKYMTPGIDPDIYEAEIDKSKIPTIKFCASGLSGDYYAIGFAINQKTKMNVEMIQTNGSADNLTRISSGECQLGLSQSDLFDTDKGKYPNIDLVGDIKQEAAILICNDDLKVKDILYTDSATIYVGADQSGSQFTLNYLKTALGLKASIEKKQSVLEAIQSASNNTKGCVFTVTSPDSKYITSIANQPKTPLRITTIDVGLKPGSKYSLVDIRSRRYGLTFTKQVNGDIATIAVGTDLVVNTDWKTTNRPTYDILLMEMQNIRGIIND